MQGIEFMPETGVVRKRKIQQTNAGESPSVMQTSHISRSSIMDRGGCSSAYIGRSADGRVQCNNVFRTLFVKKAFW